MDAENLATKWHCDKQATTTREVAGKFCTFAEGDVVRVLWDDGLTCCIERVEWVGLLPISNQLAGVPRMFLRIEAERVTTRTATKCRTCGRHHDKPECPYCDALQHRMEAGHA